MKQFKLYHKVFAIIIAMFFVFQSMSQINSHAFSSNGAFIHNESSCLIQIPTHLSHFCEEFH